MDQLSHPYMTTAKILTTQTFVSKVMSLLFNMLSRFVRASLVAQLIKNPPARWETWVQSLGWEDPLEMGKVIHSTILAYSPWDRKDLDMTDHFH